MITQQLVSRHCLVLPCVPRVPAHLLVELGSSCWQRCRHQLSVSREDVILRAVSYRWVPCDPRGPPKDGRWEPTGRRASQELSEATGPLSSAWRGHRAACRAWPRHPLPWDLHLCPRPLDRCSPSAQVKGSCFHLHGSEF